MNIALAKQSHMYWHDSKWPHEKSSLPKHDTAIYGRLDNGFRYIIQQNANPVERVSLQLMVLAGSLMEDDNEKGVAHFLEHLAFNGTKNFPAGKLIPFFQSNGMTFGKDANAYTSLKETVYEVNILNSQKSIQDALVFMRDVCDGITIASKEVEAERGVIISEKNSRDSDQHRARLRLRQFLYEDTEFVHDIIGTEQVINTVQPQVIKDFYDAWYRPENIILMAVGDIQPQEMEKLIQEKFKDLQARGQARVIFPFKNSPLKGIHVYHDSFQSDSTTVQIKAQGALQWQPDSLAVQEDMLYVAMANSILSKRLHTAIAEGKAPFLKAGARFNEVFGFFPSADIFATTEAASWQEAFEKLQNAMLVALKFGFLPEEVEEVKKSYLRTSERRMHLAKQEQNDKILKNMIGCFTHDRVYQSWEQSHVMYEKLIAKATAQNLHKAFENSWKQDATILSVTGTAKIDNAEDKLQQLWQEGLKQELHPLQAQKPVQYPYVSLPRQGGTVQTQKTFPIKNTELTLHEVTFANGLVVRILPTPFSAGKVSMGLSLGAGLGAYDDANVVRAKVATYVDAQSGFGNLSISDANRLAQEEGISVKAILDTEVLSLVSEGESKNFEKNLEALWTQYKAPFINAQNRDLALRNYAVADAKRGKDLKSALQMEALKLFWQESPRNEPILQSMAAKYDLPTLEKTLHELYATGVPVLSVVGDIDAVQSIQSVSKFFGSDALQWPSLPEKLHTTQYAFDAQDKTTVHIEVPSAVNQAAIRLAYYRPLENVQDRKILLKRRLTASILGDVMRTLIREKFGASYSPRVMYWADEVSGYGMYLVNIDTQHENFDQMRQEVSNIVADFSKKGVDAQTLQRMKKPMIGGWMQSAKQNKIYESLLSLMARRSYPYLEWHGDFTEMVKSITLEEINAEIAQAFMDSEKAMLTGVTVAPSEK